MALFFGRRWTGVYSVEDCIGTVDALGISISVLHKRDGSRCCNTVPMAGTSGMAPSVC